MIRELRNAIAESKANIAILCIALFLTTTPAAHNVSKWILWLSIPLFLYKSFFSGIELKKNSLFFIWIFFYLLMCVHSLIISPGKDWNLLLLTRLSILVMPIVFGFIWIEKINYKIIFTVYVIGCGVISISLFIIGAYKYFFYMPQYNHHNVMYELLSGPVMHPGLLSNYIFLAMAIVLEQLFFQQDVLFLSRRWQFVLLFLLIIFLGALTSKNIFIVMIIYVLLMIYRIIKSAMSPQQKRKIIFVLILLIPIFLMMVRLLVWHRFSTIFQELSSMGKDVRFNNSIGSRLSALLVGIDLMKEKLFIGYGTANGNNVLLSELHNRGYADLVKWKMHTHNQYLKYGLEYGLVGLFFFLCTLLASLFHAIKFKLYLPIILLVMLGVHCFTDDVLDVQYGILFFLPWISILLINHSFRNAYTHE